MSHVSRFKHVLNSYPLSITYPGHNEDHSHVARWLLAEQKKPLWSVSDVPGRGVGGTALCPSGKWMVELPLVTSSWSFLASCPQPSMAACSPAWQRILAQVHPGWQLSSCMHTYVNTHVRTNTHTTSHRPSLTPQVLECARQKEDVNSSRFACHLTKVRGEHCNRWTAFL